MSARSALNAAAFAVQNEAEERRARPLDSFRPKIRTDACWACMQGTDESFLDVISKCVQSDLTRLSFEQFALEIHKLHETHVRKPALDLGADESSTATMEWPEEMIMEHFLEHTIDPLAEMVRQVRDLRAIMHGLREEGLFIPHPDAKNMEVYLKMQKDMRVALETIKKLNAGV